MPLSLRSLTCCEPLAQVLFAVFTLEACGLQAIELETTVTHARSQQFTVRSGEQVTLDGSLLLGATQQGAIYHWSLLDGPDIVIVDASAPTLVFTAPEVTDPTLLVIKLTVFTDEANVRVLYTLTVIPADAICAGCAGLSCGADDGCGGSCGNADDVGCSCDDGNVCTTGETYAAGVCGGGSTINNCTSEGVTCGGTDSCGNTCGAATDAGCSTTSAIPGIIQAEFFDNGGEGLAYHDTDAGNNGASTLRVGEDVDVKTSTECGADTTTECIGWMATGEWLEYTVDVATAGNYRFDFHSATTVAAAQFHVEFDGVDKTGLVSVPVTASYTDYVVHSVTGVNLPPGQQVMRLFVDTGFFDLDYIDIVSETECSVAADCTGGGSCQTASCDVSNNCLYTDDAPTNCTAGTACEDPSCDVSNNCVYTDDDTNTCTSCGCGTCQCSVGSCVDDCGQSPYGGTAWTVPGTLEAEHFDEGGPGVAYSDSDTLNNGSSTLRDPEEVDIKIGADCGTANECLGWMATGEWIEYTVNVTATDLRNGSV